ncbi:hypothetical protein Syn7502_00292 [Synechococcus sp. PCC 7502]|uniref:hypothetical protein n=1 Tax=Synechococcus sp. PCC 7502 TaxID=1173263 RepID=UPI00029FEC0F|nr:hypothetical protein [Synechococcus sp. PCC 7502]AFY72459.1 hypothetical protein Syn7502_00292 [Synechococcus sp. PCC 7502]
MATYFLQYLMRYFWRFLKFIPPLAIASFILVGCQPSRFTQCQQIIQVTNSAKSVPVAQNPNEFTVIAQNLEGINLKVQAIALTDKTLNSYKIGFSQLYTAVAQSSRQIAQSVQERNQNNLNQSQQQLQVLADQEVALVAEVNKYCTE